MGQIEARCYMRLLRLHSELLKPIEQEIQFAQAGQKARIIIKVNALTEPQLIAALYRASSSWGTG